MTDSGNWRENLPFFPGTSVLIKRIAEQHHVLLNDPLVMSLRPDLKGEQTWAELLEVSEVAIRQVGEEIGLQLVREHMDL